MRRLLPPVLFIISVLAMVALHWLWPGPRYLGFPTSMIGGVPLLAGLILTVTAARHFDRVGTNINTFRDPGTLVIEGPFRYSRNPIYLGFAVSLLGVALLLGSISPLGVVVLFVLVTDRWYIGFEEKAMVRRFGDAYRAYQTRTRRWI